MSCLVVSSSGVRAQLLAGLLAQCAAVSIADACDSAVAAIAAINRCRPEVVILDRDADNEDCERIARHLVRVASGARLILLSSDPRLERLRQELAPLVDRTESWQALLRCVRASDEATGTPLQRGDPLPDASIFQRLRPRERAVLELLGSGLGSRDIAQTLGVSQQTVETYRKNVSAKLGVSGARLVRIAVLYSCVYLGRLASAAVDPDSDGHVQAEVSLDRGDPSRNRKTLPASPPADS